MTLSIAPELIIIVEWDLPVKGHFRTCLVVIDLKLPIEDYFVCLAVQFQFVKIQRFQGESLVRAIGRVLKTAKWHLLSRSMEDSDNSHTPLERGLHWFR